MLTGELLLSVSRMTVEWERESARMSEWAGGGQLSHSSSEKGHFYCISLIFCEATFAVDSFVGTICWRHTHRHADTRSLSLPHSLPATPPSPHAPDYLQLKLFPPYYISVSNPKMLEIFCTTSVRTLHLLKTRTDEIEKPCPRDDVGVQGEGGGARCARE